MCVACCSCLCNCCCCCCFCSCWGWIHWSQEIWSQISSAAWWLTKTLGRHGHVCGGFNAAFSACREQPCARLLLDEMESQGLGICCVKLDVSFKTSMLMLLWCLSASGQHLQQDPQTSRGVWNWWRCHTPSPWPYKCFLGACSLRPDIVTYAALQIADGNAEVDWPVLESSFHVYHGAQGQRVSNLEPSCFAHFCAL